MNFYRYQMLVDRSARPDDDQKLNLAIAGLGVTGEAGEVADIIKKYVGHGHILNTTKLIEEMGDTLWYIAHICNLLDVDLMEVAEGNIEKLRRRYPEGFSEERSRDREEA